MSGQIRKIVIVGGGSSGWMTAAYLSKALGKNVQVSLIESSSITTIGVGEATFSTIKLFFDFLGIQEQEWMPKCNASYKLAIKFENWNAQGQHFYHPFQRYEMVEGFEIAEWWLKMKHRDEPFDYSCFLIPCLCDNKLSPRYLDGTVFDEKVQDLYSQEYTPEKNVLSEHKVQIPYAYHFDANLFARFLKDYAKQRGVKQIVDNVIDVQLDKNGYIDSLITKESGNIQGDLFIDCSGFRSLLVNKVLGEPFIPFSDCLLCDRAIAMQIPKDIKRDGVNPYTTATALSSGWVWNTPLYGRDGTGYVYCSQFLSPEDAENEFRQYLGERANNIKASHIKFVSGRHRNSWVKNCVAIGLSSGFVEPLESSGIFFIQHGIEELVSHFPDKTFNPDLISSYNKNIAMCIDGVRDFLAMHYYASDRTDTPFWRATKQLAISDELKERLQLWKTRLPNSKNINPNYHGFEAYSYSVMLLGLNYMPQSSLPALSYIDEQKAIATFEWIKQRAHNLAATLPSQYEYLTHVIKSQEESEYIRENKVLQLVS